MALSDITLLDFVIKGHPVNEDFQTLDLEYCFYQRILDPIVMKTGLSYNEKTPLIINKKIKSKFKKFKEFIGRLNETDVNYVCLKGLAMNKYYPKDSIRQSNDFDFLIKDMHDFYKCYEILKGLGYSYYHYPIFTYFNGEMVGTVKFVTQVDDIESLIEINIGGFTIGELTWLNSNSLWENKELFEYMGVSFYIPSDEHNLLIFLAETSARFSPVLRDHIDFHFMYKKINPTIFKRMEENLDDRYLKQVLFDFKKVELNRVIDRAYLEKRINKKRIETKHNIPRYALREPSKLAFYYFTKVANKYIAKNKFLKVIKFLDDKVSLKRRLLKGIPIHFILVNETVRSDSLSWETTGGYNFIRTPIGLYMASGFCIIFDDEVDEINETFGGELH